MNKKYFVVFGFFILLVITINMMVNVENNIRKERTIIIDSTKVRINLLPEYNRENLISASENSLINFKVEEDYFQQLSLNKSNKKQWHSIFLKGVNLGAALPGKFPSQFPEDFDLYMDWFKKIGEMNANIVRIYTIFPPVFYEAFANYNLIHSDKPLYLMQGVWATVPKNHNYLDEEYSYEFQKEIKDVIDVIHGNNVIEKAKGKANGVYISDVSKYTISYLLGREWEPKGVVFTNKNNSISSFVGDFVSVPKGNPMEIWLGKMLDYTLKYETLKYKNQHPVSFVNWLPLDPMFHNSEFIENKKVREFDNDLESIDFRKYYKTNLVKTGIYAAYHAYPYYPDFIYLDEKYRKSKDNYFSYLKDLKDHCPNMPLIIAEYGVPSSRGNSHFSPFGFDQGGHNEKEQARINKILTEDIEKADCGGAIIFEWIDEWFKFNWMVMDFEQPQHRRKEWHNMENPEQNFGIMAMENRKNYVKRINNSENMFSKNNLLNADADPSYFYLAYKLNNFDFKKNNLYIAIDTYDKEKGDHLIPIFKKHSDTGIEFFLKFVSPDSAQILVDDQYSVFSDIYHDYIPIYSSKKNNNGRFVPQELIANRMRESLLGKKYHQILYNRSKLVFGKISENSNSDWYFDKENKILNMRIPWHLLNVSDPSSLQVLDDKQGTAEIETTTIKKFKIFSFVTGKNNKIVYTIPKNGKNFSYVWKGWETPKYETRLKKQYWVLKNVFENLHPKKEIKSKKIKDFFKITKWAENKSGAISVTFDDGDFNQFKYAFPILTKYKLHADFGIVGSWTAEKPQITTEKGGFGIKRMGWEEIRTLHNAGNEISSHGYFHEKIDVRKPEEKIIHELRRNKKLIQKNIKDSIFTIHYPYSFTRDKIIECTKKSGFLFGRLGDGNKKNTDRNLFRINSKVILNENNPTPNQFFNWIKNAKNNWLVLMYHHIFPKDSKPVHLFEYYKVTNRYSVTPKEFDNQMRLLRNSDYWIATTSEVGKYITEREKSKLNFTLGENSHIVEIKSNLNTKIYNQPLTIEFDTNWKIIKITNSKNDGIYNSRNGKIFFPAELNKKIIIEKVK